MCGNVNLVLLSEDDRDEKIEGKKLCEQFYDGEKSQD